MVDLLGPVPPRALKIHTHDPLIETQVLRCQLDSNLCTFSGGVKKKSDWNVASSFTEMSHCKPLLIPWLRESINSNKYPGVQWTNQERTEFSIPWKHALRQDSSDADILIFKVTE